MKPLKLNVSKELLSKLTSSTNIGELNLDQTTTTKRKRTSLNSSSTNYTPRQKKQIVGDVPINLVKKQEKVINIPTAMKTRQNYKTSKIQNQIKDNQQSRKTIVPTTRREFLNHQETTEEEDEVEEEEESQEEEEEEEIDGMDMEVGEWQITESNRSHQ